MKITMYELLGMVKDGKAPKEIRFDNMKWHRINGEKNVYYTNDYDSDLFIYFFRRNLTFTLKDEVEILDNEDEEKELPEKLYHCCMESENEEIKFLIQNINDLADKYNDLLDYLEKKRKGE